MTKNDPSSFRDPSAFVFTENGRVYRHIAPSYREAYDRLMSSGLYASLTSKAWLIPHEESTMPAVGAYKVILPQQIPFINYPYEWSFSQLRDAALLTLRIQKESMRYGMSLKDATAFNIVFEDAGPVFIDSCSFEPYDEGRPWIAYRQFCENFLAPLLLSSYWGSDMLGMLLQHPDGIPVPLASRLLPFRSRFSLLSLLHIHLQKAVSGSPSSLKTTFRKEKLLRIIDHLERGIGKLNIQTETSAWSRYYQDSILPGEYLEHKKSAVAELTRGLSPKRVVDLGANTGEFAEILKARGRTVIAADLDRLCTDRIYTTRKGIIPIAADLMYPSPAIGWMNRERRPLLERIQADLVLALALVHHLCIGKNLPLPMLAEGLSQIGGHLLIEFVPKDDPKVLTMLAHRRDIFDQYTEEEFRKAFESHFTLVREAPLPGSGRKLFLYQKRS
jgi:hypothetical protein